MKNIQFQVKENLLRLNKISEEDKGVKSEELMKCIIVELYYARDLLSL